jgi:hypothetical protein
MAVLTNPGVIASGGGTGQPRWALLSFQKVTAADTYDATTLTTIAPFAVVTSALFVATSNRTATTALATGTPGTTLTVVGTGIANDAGYFFLVGE